MDLHLTNEQADLLLLDRIIGTATRYRRASRRCARSAQNPKEMRLELARWAAPYCTPRLASISVVKSIHEMTDAELDWAISDAQKPGPGRPGGTRG